MNGDAFAHFGNLFIYFWGGSGAMEEAENGNNSCQVLPFIQVKAERGDSSDIG